MGFAVVGAFHLIFLQFPPVSFDDVSFADYALHGQMSLWKDILPSGQRFLIQTWGGIGIWPTFTSLLRWSCQILGTNLFALRLPAALGGLATLVVLGAILMYADFPASALWSLLLFAITQSFFEATHRVRPESLVLLVITCNALWLISTQGRLMSWMAGVAMAFAITIHTAAAIFLSSVTVLVFTYRHQCLRIIRTIWWTVGVVSGISIALPFLNVSNFAQTLPVYYGGNIVAPPLLRWKWDPMHIIMHELAFIGTYNRMGNDFYLLWISLLLSIWTWQIRRYRALDNHRQLLCLMTTCLLAAHTLLSASDNVIYWIYIYPWLWIQGAVVLADLFQGRIKLDTVDIGLWVASVLAVYVTSYSAVCLTSYKFISLWTIFGFLFFLLTKIRRTRRILYSIICFTLILGMCNLDSIIVAWTSLKYLFQYRFLLLTAFFLWPWIIFTIGESSIKLRLLYDQTQEHTIAILGLCLFIFYQLNDACLLYKRMEQQHRLWPESQRLIAEIRQKRRIAAPDALWIYTQNPEFQAVDSIPFVEKYTHRPFVQRQLQIYKPSLILWPCDMGADPALPGYEYQRSWNTIFGKLDEIMDKKIHP